MATKCYMYMNIHKTRAHDVAINFYAILQCTTLAFTISLDIIGCVISQKILWVTWPNKQRQSTEGQWPVNSNGAIFNKSIGDDTKATARQSPNCIKKQKINLAKNDFQYGGWNYYTLQCRMWLWNHDIEFARWQHHAVCQLALGWHAIEFAQTSAILQFYIWFRVWP